MESREADMLIAEVPRRDHRDTLQNDPVNHPSHYTDGGIETLDYILAKRLDFLSGQVIKYVSRAGKKDPEKEIEDLEKARFYLDRKIERLKNGSGMRRMR